MGGGSLVYGGPWGVSMVLAGHLRRPASTSVLVMVAASGAAAIVGPHMAGLVPEHPAPFAAVLLMTLLLIGVLLSSERRPLGSRGVSP